MRAKFSLFFIFMLSIMLFGPARRRIGNFESNSCSQDSEKNSNASPSRIAYLISINASSPRTIRSRSLLESAGFNVQLEMAPTGGRTSREKVQSNRLAQLRIYSKISQDKYRPWGYVFEDDILLVGTTASSALVEANYSKGLFSVADDLTHPERGIENQHSLFVYLGIIISKYSKFHKGLKHHKRVCGRGAHAYGLSRKGAINLLEYNGIWDRDSAPGKPICMDLVMNNWCLTQGGFPLLHKERVSPQNRHHYGAFYQDRQTFPTMIRQ